MLEDEKLESILTLKGEIHSVDEHLNYLDISGAPTVEKTDARIRRCRLVQQLDSLMGLPFENV